MGYSDDFIMSPKNDFAFKEIMVNEKVRKGFLSAVFDIPDTDVKTTIMLNTNLRKEHEDEKQGVLDVRLIMNDDTEIDIEIQLSYMKSWADRSTFYLCRMVSEQSDINKTYSNMKKCAAINILDFNYTETKRFHTTYHVREDKEHLLFTDKIEWHIIEMPKLPVNEDGTRLYDWVKFLSSKNREDFEMLAKRNAYIDEAYKQLDIISQDKLKRIEYMSREKALNDYTTFMNEHYDQGHKDGKVEGRAEGIEIGEKKGRAEGIALGREEGRLEEREKIKEMLKANGISEEQISKMFDDRTRL